MQIVDRLPPAPDAAQLLEATKGLRELASSLRGLPHAVTDEWNLITASWWTGAVVGALAGLATGLILAWVLRKVVSRQ